MSQLTLRNIVGGLVITFVLFACKGREKKELLSPLYFDVTSVIDRQVNLLDSLKPGITKTLSINNSSEETTLKRVDWNKELEIFKDADINSPVLRETFKIKEFKKPEGYSIHYLPIEANNKGVTQLVITFNKENQLQDIFCKIVSNDWLYSFERTLNLKFSGKEEVLESYIIKNSQEILFKKKEESNLNGRLIFSS